MSADPREIMRDTMQGIGKHALQIATQIINVVNVSNRKVSDLLKNEKVKPYSDRWYRIQAENGVFMKTTVANLLIELLNYYHSEDFYMRKKIMAECEMDDLVELAEVIQQTMAVGAAWSKGYPHDENAIASSIARMKEHFKKTGEDPNP